MNRNQKSIEAQIQRAISARMQPATFITQAEHHEAEAAAMRYGNKGAATREANRCRIVAAALKAKGL